MRVENRLVILRFVHSFNQMTLRGGEVVEFFALTATGMGRKTSTLSSGLLDQANTIHH